MPARRFRDAETWLWTGPVGHLVGGALDVITVLARHLLTRAGARRRERTNLR